MRHLISVLALTTVFALSAGTIPAGEHPEHPTDHSKKVEKKEVTMKDLAKSIEGYIAGDSKLKGGYFLVYDDVNKEPLQLSLDKVHKERLSKLKENVYFACADFKTPKGKIYDLDVFMEGSHPDYLKTTEVIVHKESGKARYGWAKEKGLWIKVPDAK